MSFERRPSAAGAAELQERLRHVYWIGGGSGAGKSTIARRLADLYGLRVYGTDDAMRDHDRRSNPDDVPFLSRFKAMDMDERWLNRPPNVMLETFHWFRGEAFSLIVDDLLATPSSTKVLVEGFRLLPYLVKPLLAESAQAVWLLPSPAFRQAAFDSRGTTWDIPNKTSDPERTRRNLLERDRMFTDQLREETNELGLTAVEIDLETKTGELTDEVAQALAL